MDYEIEMFVCNKVEDEIVDALNNLMPQLSKTASVVTRERLQEIISHDACKLVLLKINGKIAGCTMLVMFPLPSGKRAWIEDVVLDSEYRGCGWGEALVKEAIKLAKEHGAISIDLTSRPSRVAANKLYQRIGFQSRYTNVYRYEL